MSRRLLAVVAAAVATLGLVASRASAGASPPPAAPAAAAAQTLTWTANDSITQYASAPTTAVAGETTIVFENSEATGNTTGMSHTLTFDTSTPGYNHDVNVNILANPFDADNGRHEVTVTLTPGKYRYHCTIPGHSTMVGEFTVTDGGGGDDTTAPTVSASVAGDQDENGAYVGKATVTVTADDGDGSGVDSVEYQVDGGTWTTYSAPFDVTEVGDHTVAYRATDVAGNTSDEGTVTFSVVAGGGGDTTPPTVSADVTGAQDDDGNYVGSATVTVTAADEGGLASVEYQINDTGWNPYTEPVQITTIGQYVVLLRATDAAGNVGTGQVNFTVVEAPSDTTPPTVTAEVSGTQDDDGDYVDVATVTLSATDTGSGVKSVEYKLDDGDWTAYTAAIAVNTPGEHMVSYRATDNANNTSDEGMAMFTVVQQDTEAPTVTGEVIGSQDENGAYIGSAMVKLTATDSGSGVASVEYTLDGGEWTAYTDAVQVSAVGDHTVTYRATDAVGNVSEEGTLTFTVVAGDVDDTPPSVSAVVSGNQNSSWQFLDAATITITALDTGSGVGSVEYRLDDGDWTAYTAPVTVDSVGEHTFSYRATDVAGNGSAEQTGAFTIVEDGPGDAPDVCPNSDVRDTVIVGDVDSQVPNVDTGNGCTINDVIDEDAGWPTHNAFVRFVKQVTKELVKNGVIDRDQRDRIVAAAIASDVGPTTSSKKA
jgi:uncharacterized cupredoxin-like copper-binding protein